MLATNRQNQAETTGIKLRIKINATSDANPLHVDCKSGGLSVISEAMQKIR